jgi:DNA-binding MarR family transcriptional regulator
MSGFDTGILQTVALECPGFQARATARAITRYFNHRFKPFGLTAEQFSLLVGIGSIERATLAELSLAAGIDPTTLSRNARNLEVRGWVRSKGGRGRTGKQLNLASAGMRLVDSALPAGERPRRKN